MSVSDNFADLRDAPLGNVREWHSPHNGECPHNSDAMLDCACKRKVVRKGYRVVRVTDPQADRAHKIVSEIHPNGLLVLRQAGRRKRVSVSLGVLYERLVWNEAMRLVREAKSRRKKTPGGRK